MSGGETLNAENAESAEGRRANKGILIRLRISTVSEASGEVKTF